MNIRCVGLLSVSCWHRLLNDFLVDVVAKLHAILCVTVVVCVSWTSFNVLVNSIDLRFIRNKAFFNLIKSVVNVRLEKLVFASVMLHAMVSHLLWQTILVLSYQLFDDNKSWFLLFELVSQIVSFWEFVLNIVFHFIYTFSYLSKFILNSVFKVFDLLKIPCACVYFNLKFGGCVFSIIKLSLFKLEVILHFSNVGSRWKGSLPFDVVAHMGQKTGNHLLFFSDINFIFGFLFFETCHEIVDLFFFLIKNFVFLHIISIFFVLKVTFDFLNVSLVSIDHLSCISKFLIKLFDFLVLRFDTIHKTLTGFGER